jgi:hypothetical protein
MLWWHLIAGRQTGVIPGLCSIGEAAFAEQLRWSLKGFREAFAEVFREGMVEADWEAQLVWVKNAVKYNSPANPNVVLSWRDSWEELPECALKVQAGQYLKYFVEGLGKGFGEAFAEVYRNPLANQEQEQEQEQEKEQEKEKDPPHPPRGQAAGFEEFWSQYPRKQKKQAASKAWQKLRPSPELLAEIMAAVARQITREDWRREEGRFVPNPEAWLNGRRWEDEGSAALKGETITDKLERIRVERERRESCNGQTSTPGLSVTPPSLPLAPKPT